MEKIKNHDKPKNPTTVAIIVRGGVVQGVLSTRKNVEVELFDYDNEPDRSDPDIKKFQHYIF